MLEWKGKHLTTYSDIGTALLGLENRAEAESFMKLYRENNVYAYQNVGYLVGYFDRETAMRLMDWCETSHPIFGRWRPTAEEAFEMGKRMAQVHKGERDDERYSKARST